MDAHWTTLRLLIGAATFGAFTGCQTLTSPQAPVRSEARYVNVNGARVPYVERGSGPLVVLVHGAAADHRLWSRQQAVLAQNYRVVSYTLRYFGTEPWGSEGPKFGVNTHAAELAALIRGLGGGPAHVVGWSYGASVGLATAQQHPEVVRSAFLYEPAHPTYVTEPADLRALVDDRGNFAPAVRAVKSGDDPAAARALFDAVDNRNGVLAGMSQSGQAMVLENARTMPLLLTAQDPPPPISCMQLGQIKPPVSIARGELTRPFYRIIADTAARCIPNGRHMVVPGARHFWPDTDAAAFSETVLLHMRRY